MAIGEPKVNSDCWTTVPYSYYCTSATSVPRAELGECHGCGNTYALRPEHYSMCARCWVDLDDDERAVLRGENPSAEPQRVVTYTLPARPGLLNRLLVTVLGTMGGTTAALGLWHWMGW